MRLMWCSLIALSLCVGGSATAGAQAGGPIPSAERSGGAGEAPGSALAGRTAAEPSPCALGAASLARDRDRAVLRGARWIERYLRSRAHFERLVDDAPSIFAELGLTARHGPTRRFALRTARRIVMRAARYYLRPGKLEGMDDLRNAIAIADLGQELGRPQPVLVEATSRRFDALPTRHAALEVAPDELARLPSDDLFGVLIGAYALDRAQLTFPGRFRASFGLREVLREIAARRWTEHTLVEGKERERFYEDAYLLTHVGFVLNDYGRIALPVGRLRRTVAYLDRQFAPLLAEEEVELVAEIVDLWRAGGRGEATDARMCRATRFLLGAQNDDGSWGEWWDEEDPYDAVHYTWTVIHALRDRSFLGDTPFAGHVRRVLEELPGL